MNTQHIQISFIRKLLTGKTELEIQEAEVRFLNYLEIVKRIHARISKERLNKT